MVWRLVGPVLIAALASAPAAGAQARDCPYSRCALWLVGGTTVLQGAEGTPVGSGAFVPRVELLATASDTVRRHYQASRMHDRRASVLGGIAFAALLGTVTYYEHRERWGGWSAAPGVGLPLATVAFGWASGAQSGRGEEHLEQAVWFYNGDLPAEAGAAADTDPKPGGSNHCAAGDVLILAPRSPDDCGAGGVQPATSVAPGVVHRSHSGASSRSAARASRPTPFRREIAS